MKFINLIALFMLTTLYTSFCFSQVNIESKRTDLKNNSKLISELGLDLRKGAVKELEIKYALRFDYKFNSKHKLINLFEYSYGEANDEKFKNEMFFHSRLTSMIWNKEKLGFELFVQTQKNEFYNINLRQLLGTGLRYKLFHINIFDGYIGLGLMKEYENLQNEKDNNDIRSTNYLTFILEKNKKYKILNTTYYQPLINNYRDYRINSEFAVIFEFSKNIGLKNSVVYLYDSNPPEDIEKSNISTNVNFVAKF
jgi:putative salt-induced outer membrane protein YdiY